MKRQKENHRDTTPLLRVRHLAAIAAGVSLFIAGPLGMVWKQVYINQISVRQTKLSDSLIVLNKQAARLRLSIEKYSSTSRIEAIARDCLNLDYPSASQIVIIKHSPHGKAASDSGSNYLAILKRSMGRGRG
jgi:cell division protein FtsL